MLRTVIDTMECIALMKYFSTGFLVHFESEVLRRAHKSFSFRNGRWVYATRHLVVLVKTDSRSLLQRRELFPGLSADIFQVFAVRYISVFFYHE